MAADAIFVGAFCCVARWTYSLFCGRGTSWLALRNVLAKTVRATFDRKSAVNQFAILFGERFTQARG
ncbi:hypothetical protein [Burkholderia cepacia]|uniref:hypothetical protein n=1 Tax=Burkholderia cepacia TaxID=292 RepID=UPI0013F47BFA|nr:hypothetical protein [Burkholderia cepacia]